MTKRIICVLMLLILASQGCLAQGVILNKVEEENHIPLGGVLFEEGEAVACDEEPVSFFSTLSFDEYIAEFVLSSEGLPEEIAGLASYGITKDEFTFKYYDAVLKHPETLLGTAHGGFLYNTTSGVVSSVKPVYLVDSKEDADTAREQMDAAVKEYTDLAAKYDTDLEKLLVIHDKMVAECDYDVNVLNEATESLAERSVYHAFGALCKKKAVCQGYSQALYMIANKIGIEMDFCRSAERNHMWNYVKLDGKWYHMDMTNDDPLIKDENGNTIARTDTRAWHRYFMVSDSGLVANAHGTDFGPFVGEYTCDDTRYESDHLFNLGFLFTAEREADEYFHVRNSTNVSAFDIGNVTIDYKSKSLYTGAVVTAPCIAYGKYTENNMGTNLYLFQSATRDVPSLLPVVKGPARISVLSAQSPFEKDTGYVRIIRSNIDKSSVDSLAIFLWEKDTLTPYSTKTEWNRE